MTKTIYRTVITQLGESVEEFLEQGMLVTFKDNAPAELAEYCILHAENDLREDIQVDDTLKIADETFKVTAVGSAVQENLKSLGHITLSFNGETEPEMPGTLSLESKAIGTVQVGDVIEIVR